MTSQRASSPSVRAIARGGRAWTGLLAYGLLVPPLAWALALYLNFALASHACYPHEAPRTSFLPGWERIWIVLLAVSVVCAGVCAIGLLASGYSWRRLRDDPPAGEEIGGTPSPAEGRLGSFAACGLMVSGLFTVTLAFNILFLWALSTCSQV